MVPLEFTIRPARPDDFPAIWRLAALDEARVPSEPLLLAVVGDELWAALSLKTGESIADPFRESGELAAILTQRARQLQNYSAAKRESWLAPTRAQPGEA